MGIDQIVDSMQGSVRDVQRLQKQMQILMRTLARFDELSARYMADEGSYAYIPLHLEDFTDSLVDLEAALTTDKEYKHPKLPHRPITYLEVGCGIGRNLFVVLHGSGLQIKKARGIEISLPYVVQAREFFSLHEEVSVNDAMKFDYSEYDVIYFYRPFSDEKLERKFERRLIRQAKPGSYLVGHLNSLFDKTKSLTPVHPFSRVYKKRSAEPEKKKPARKKSR
jgi:SAM-dependent methyltransferase